MNVIPISVRHLSVTLQNIGTVKNYKANNRNCDFSSTTYKNYKQKAIILKVKKKNPFKKFHNEICFEDVAEGNPTQEAQQCLQSGCYQRGILRLFLGKFSRSKKK